MSRAVLYQGDVRDVLASLPERSVQCCITSPPYWGLRDYGTGKWEGGNAECDHIEKRSARRDSPGGYHNSRNDRSGRTQPNTQATVLPFRDTCGKCGATRLDQQLGLERTPDCGLHPFMRLRGDLTEDQRVYVAQRLLGVSVPDALSGGNDDRE